MPLRFGAIKVVTSPAAEPVSVAQAKAQLRILHNREDDYLNGLIKVSREWAEDYTRMAFITQTIDAQYPGWPAQFTPNLADLDSTFLLPRPPLQAVTSVKYRDTADAEQTLDPSKYIYDNLQSPGTVRIKQSSYGNPVGSTLSSNYVNPITIRFTCGYGGAVDVPNRVMQAILIMVAHLYARRTIVEVDMRLVMVEIPFSARELLNPLKLRLV